MVRNCLGEKSKLEGIEIIHVLEITLVINAHPRFNHKLFKCAIKSSTDWRISWFDDE